MRGETRDNWLTNYVMKRIWDEGGQYLPICPKQYWVKVDWHFPVLPVMYSVNFVWYNVEEEVTCACIKENPGKAIEGKRITEKGIMKPETICIG